MPLTNCIELSNVSDYNVMLDCNVILHSNTVTHLSYLETSQKDNVTDLLRDKRSISQAKKTNMEHARLKICQKRKNDQKEKQIRNNMRPKLPCVVCTATTVYSYYGAIVCDPCRTFFRRQVMGQKVCQTSLVSLFNFSLLHRNYNVHPLETVKSLPIPGRIAVGVDSKSVCQLG